MSILPPSKHLLKISWNSGWNYADIWVLKIWLWVLSAQQNQINFTSQHQFHTITWQNDMRLTVAGSNLWSETKDWTSQNSPSELQCKQHITRMASLLVAISNASDQSQDEIKPEHLNFPQTLQLDFRRIGQSLWHLDVHMMSTTVPRLQIKFNNWIQLQIWTLQAKVT